MLRILLKSILIGVLPTWTLMFVGYLLMDTYTYMDLST